jgi:RNA polymerase sigma factor (sigma-70 family)
MNEASTHLTEFSGWDDPRRWASLVTYLWGRFQPLVFRRCLASGLQPSDADDLVQSIWMNIYPKLREFVQGFQRTEPRRAQFRPWILTCTRNAIIDHRLKMNRSPGVLPHDIPAMELAEAISEDFEECTISDSCLRETIQMVRNRVNSDTWHAFVERVIKGRAYKDIADGKRTVNSVEASVRRVTRLIQRQYEKSLASSKVAA